MHKILFIFLITTALFAQRQGIVTDGVSRRVTRPNSFTTLSQFRFEGRVRLPNTCNVTSTSESTIQSTGSVGIGCLSTDASKWGFSNASTLQEWYTPGTATPATFNAGQEYFFSVQRTGKSASDKFEGKAWALDGTVVAYRSVGAVSAWSPVSGSVDVLRGNVNPGMVVHHLCWYSDAKDDLANMPMPKDNECTNGTLAQIGGFLFDGTLDGIGGGSLACASSCTNTYRHSTVSGLNDGIYPPPVLQIFATSADGQLPQAGAPIKFDASTSFTFDGVPLSGLATWSQVSGPSDLFFENARAATTTAVHAVAGTYAIKFTVGSTSKTENITMMARDLDGLLLVPNYAARQPVSLRFRIADVLNATDVQVEVRRPDGGAYPAVTCTTSPCQIWVDSRQNDHLFRLTYRNLAGKSLAVGSWQRLTNVATAVDAPLTPAVSYGRQLSMTKYGATSWNSNLALAAKMWYRAGDRVWGDALPEAKLLGHTTRPGAIHAIYIDQATAHTGTKQSVGLGIAELVDSNGERYYEQAFAHTYKNGALKPESSFTTNILWKGRDMFGAANANSAFTSTTDGVLLSDGTACPAGCTDVSNAAYSTATNDVGITSSKPYLVITYDEQFDEVNWEVSTTPSGCTITRQYWNGSGWSSFLLASDSTASLTTNGRWRFTPPANWQRSVQSTYNATKNNSFFAIRVGFAGCSRWPTFSRVYGDDWRIPEVPISNRRMYMYTPIGRPDGAKFSSMVVNVSAPGESVAATYQYSKADGTWGTLTISSTGAKLQTAGTFTLSWTAPTDWAPYDHTGSGIAKHWIRMGSGSNTETPSIVSSVTIGGAAAISSGGMRGWNPTHANVVRPGTSRAYNPNPPSDASARFEYQSRVRVNFWNPAINTDWCPNLTRLAYGSTERAVQFWYGALFRSVIAASPGVHNGLFFDNGAHRPGPDNLAQPSQIMLSKGNGDFNGNQAEVANWYRDFVQFAAKANQFPGFKVGYNGTNFPYVAPNLGDANDFTMAQCKLGDFCKQEGYMTWGPMATTPLTNLGSPTWHNLWARELDPMASNNPRGAVLSFHCMDYLQFPLGGDGVRFFHDPSFRSPMSCYSAYLQAANDYTRFGYTPDNVTFYGTTIDVWKKGTPGTLDAEVDNNSTSICSSIFASIPVGSTVYEYSIGGMGIQQLRKTTPGQCMAYSQPGTPNVIQTWPAGAQIYPVEKCLYGVTCAPRMADVLKWGWLNGAFMTDIGVPTAARATYRTPVLNGTKRDLYVRPFTKAVAMHVLGDTSNDSGANDFPVRSGVTINFESAGWCSGTGCRLYPLMTDGYTSNAVCPSATRTSDGGCTGYAPFRAGDGQVFMREPIQ